MITTYQFRIKDSNKKKLLKELSNKVNFVWNYFNEVSEFAWKRDRKWLSDIDLNSLTYGSSKTLGLLSDVINTIAREYSYRRNKVKRCKLKWRSSKRNLGWIPLQARNLKIDNDTIIFAKTKYKFWKSRDVKGKIKTASFSENAKGEWFINLHCEVDSEQTENKEAVGIDLGLKTLAILSDGSKIENPKVLKKYEEKLAKAQRANKKKQVTNIQNKIKNVRKDFLHKESTKIINKYGKILVGDVSSTKLVKTKMAKSVLDSGWGTFKSMLEYKAIRLGVEFKVVSEKYSSVTCSGCFERSGPRGLGGLGVREWICNSCGLSHHRDINSAINILLGLEC